MSTSRDADGYKCSSLFCINSHQKCHYLRIIFTSGGDIVTFQEPVIKRILHIPDRRTIQTLPISDLIGCMPFLLQAISFPSTARSLLPAITARHCPAHKATRQTRQRNGSPALRNASRPKSHTGLASASLEMPSTCAISWAYVKGYWTGSRSGFRLYSIKRDQYIPKLPHRSSTTESASVSDEGNRRETPTRNVRLSPGNRSSPPRQ